MTHKVEVTDLSTVTKQDLTDEAPGDRLPRWRLRLPIRRVVIAEVIAAVLVAPLAPIAPWWVLALVAAVVALGAVSGTAVVA